MSVAGGGGMGGIIRRLEVLVQMRENVSQQVGRVNASLGSVARSAAGAGHALQGTGMAFGIMAMSAAAALGMALRTTAEFNRQALLASFAARDAGTSLSSLSRSALDLSSSLNQSPVAMATLIRSVQQLGVDSGTTATNLSRSAAALNLLTNGEVTSDAAATSLYRLIQATDGIKVGMERALLSSDRYASAIYVAGNKSAASTSGVLAMVRSMQGLGTLTNITTGEVITLSAALANVDDKARSAFSSSLTRIFSTEFSDPARGGIMARFLGMSPEEFQKLRVDEPFRLILHFINQLQAAAGDSRGKRLDLLRQLGFDNVRDIKTIAALTQNLGENGGKLMDIYRAVNHELGTTGTLALFGDMNTIMYDLTGSWNAFTASLQRFGIVVGNILGPILIPLLHTLTGIVDVLSKHKVITALGLGAAAAGAGAYTMNRGAGGIAQTLGAFGMLLPGTFGYLGRTTAFAGGRLSFLGGSGGIGGRAGSGGGANMPGGAINPREAAMMLDREATRMSSARTTGKLPMYSPNLAGDSLESMRESGEGRMGPMDWVMYGMMGQGMFGGKGSGLLSKLRHPLKALGAGGRGVMAGLRGASVFGKTAGLKMLLKGEMGLMAQGGGKALMGRGMALGGRALIGMSNPVTAALLAASALTPLTRRLGQFFEQMRKGGGILGHVAGVFEIAFKTIELVGNAINAIFKFIGKMIMKIPGVKWLLRGSAKVFGGVGDTLDKWNAGLSGKNGSSSGPAVSVVNNNIFNDNGDRAPRMAAMNSMAAGQMYSYGNFQNTLAPAGTVR